MRSIRKPLIVILGLALAAPILMGADCDESYIDIIGGLGDSYLGVGYVGDDYYDDYYYEDYYYDDYYYDDYYYEDYYYEDCYYGCGDGWW